MYIFQFNISFFGSQNRSKFRSLCPKIPFLIKIQKSIKMLFFRSKNRPKYCSLDPKIDQNAVLKTQKSTKIPFFRSKNRPKCHSLDPKIVLTYSHHHTVTLDYSVHYTIPLPLVERVTCHYKLIFAIKQSVLSPHRYLACVW